MRRGRRPGKGVTFLGVKFNYPKGERICSDRRVDGCPFPACDKGVKSHRKASIMPSENGPCGGLHGPRSHSAPFTTAQSLNASFPFCAPTPFLPPASSHPSSPSRSEKSLYNAGVDSSAPLWTVNMWTTFTGCLSTSSLISDIS